MILIGEKINGTRKPVARAIEARDRDWIQKLALRQVEAGAQFLDLNAGTAPDREPADMRWLVETVQAVTNVPLFLDSPNPEAIAEGLSVAARPPGINSVSGEKRRMERILSMARGHSTSLVVLALGDSGIPRTVEDRLRIVRHLVARIREEGVPDERLFIDPLVTALAMDTESGRTAFECIRQIRAEFPMAHITAGLSNISFGLPARSVVNQAFAVLAIASGMDSAILDPEDRALTSILFAAEAVLGKDSHCLRYTRAYRAARLSRVPESSRP